MSKINSDLLTITLISLLLLVTLAFMKLDPDTLFKILKFVERLAGTGL